MRGCANRWARAIGTFAVVGAAAGAAAVAADTITFEELGPQPCNFVDTQALSDEYAAVGVLFAGPQPGQGGAILDQCSNFGINARSGVHFLAFNTSVGYPRWPETITFTEGAGRVELFASAGIQSGVLTVEAFDAANNLVDTQSVSMSTGLYSMVEVLGDIDHIVISASTTFLVIDDLSWDVSGRYNLNVSGQCPGTVTVRWSGATPSQQQGLVFGADQGSTIIPTGPCQGTMLGVQGQVRLVNTFGTGNGAGTISGLAGTSACGHFLQLVESGSCNTSNVRQIP
ncbi:MAG: hypothetical protein IT430_20185 [Phycisphaerales bacterium]|nr:hypothetical protein [Phycisphaerales bacterium]